MPSRLPAPKRRRTRETSGADRCSESVSWVGAIQNSSASFPFGCWLVSRPLEAPSGLFFRLRSRACLDRARLHLADCLQMPANAGEFVLVKCGKLRENLLAAGRQRHADVAAIAGPLLFLDQALLGRTLDQPHHRVVPLLKELRQLRDGGPAAPGIARDSEQELMVLRSHAAPARHLLAEAQELPKLIAEPSHAPHQDSVGRGPSRATAPFHAVIISQCDLSREGLGQLAGAGGRFCTAPAAGHYSDSRYSGGTSSSGTSLVVTSATSASGAFSTPLITSASNAWPSSANSSTLSESAPAKWASPWASPACPAVSGPRPFSSIAAMVAPCRLPRTASLGRRALLLRVVLVGAVFLEAAFLCVVL